MVHLIKLDPTALHGCTGVDPGFSRGGGGGGGGGGATAVAGRGVPFPTQSMYCLH